MDSSVIMSRKNKITNIILFVLFLCSIAGCIISFTTKPTLYYSSLVSENVSVSEDFNKQFKMVRSMDLVPNGNCNAGKNDFVLLQCSDQLIPIAEKLADQGAKVLILNRVTSYYGQIYYKDKNTMRSVNIHGNSLKDISSELRTYAFRKEKMFFLISTCILFLCSFITFILTIPKEYIIWGSENERSVGALLQLNRRKYSISIISALLMIILTYAWLTVPNIYMFTKRYFEIGVFISSLISLPFFAYSIFALLNLTRMKQYRRWVNLISLIFTGIAVGMILISIIIMAFNK